MLFSESFFTNFQLVSASPNWYSNVGHTNRLDYQDSPIQWHPNPMYSGVMEDMDPRSMDYGLTELPSAQPTMIINTAASVQQRSISRFVNYLFWYMACGVSTLRKQRFLGKNELNRGKNISFEVQ